MSPRVLIIPGYNGSGADHWQTRWQILRSDCARVEQRHWDDPDPALWVRALDYAVAAAARPVVLVAHSLGCATVAHWAARHAATAPHVAAALLVAPCDVERAGLPPGIARFAPLPPAPLPFRSIVVASSNDSFASFDRARDFARRWGSNLVDAGPIGHINAASRLGDWAFGQALLDGLLADATPQPAFA